MYRLHFIFFIAASMFFFAAGCTKGTETVKLEKQIPVKTLTIGSLSSSEDRNYVGTVEESYGISLSFSLMGTVERVAVSQGQRVSKGQLLATLNSGTVQNTYNIAKSTLKQAQDAYDRIKSLHDKGSVTDIQFVEVETGLEKAKGMEAIAKKNLDDCRLYAPRSGVIASRSVEAGSSVMPGIEVFKLVSIEKINVKISIPENEIGQIAQGQQAKVEVPALGNAVFTGKIETKGVAANPISHTYEAKISINNPKSQLMPGMVCKVSLAGDAKTAEIVVPNRTIQIATDGSRYVWVADNGVAKRRFVQIGGLNDSGIVIVEGLSAGDKIIVEGFQKVSEGMKVVVNEEK